MSPGLLDEVVDYFQVYRSDPELTVAVPELVDGQPSLTISIGGGTPGRAYADNHWVYAVHLDGVLVASGADLRSGGIGRTHQQMAAVLAVFLADTDRVPALAGHADRLSLWAHDVETGGGDD